MLSQPKTGPYQANAFIYLDDDKPPKRIHQKWYQGPEPLGDFLHFCGRLSDKKTLAGFLHEEKHECTCCGTKAPEQVLMLQKLQQLNKGDRNGR